MHRSAKLTIAVVAFVALAIVLGSAYINSPQNYSKSVLGLQTCSSFTYTDWSLCINGEQTRNVVASDPNCAASEAQLTQTCDICTDFDYSEWSACNNGRQIRSVTTARPQNCTGGIPRLSQSCNAGNLTSLVQMINGDQTLHLLVANSTDKQVLLDNGYKLENQLGYIYSRQGDDTIPLYVLVNPKTTAEIYTTDANEKSSKLATGYVLKTVLGYIYNLPGSDRIPVYYLQNNTQTYFTTEDKQKDSLIRYGYQLSGIIGYTAKSAR